MIKQLYKVIDTGLIYIIIILNIVSIYYNISQNIISILFMYSNYITIVYDYNILSSMFIPIDIVI